MEVESAGDQNCSRASCQEEQRTQQRLLRQARNTRSKNQTAWTQVPPLPLSVTLAKLLNFIFLYKKMTSPTSDVVMNLKWDNEWKTLSTAPGTQKCSTAITGMMTSTVTPSGMSNRRRDVLRCRVYYRFMVSHHASSFYLNWGFSRTLSAFSPLSPHLLEVGSQERGWLFAPTGLYQCLLSKCPKHSFEPIKTWEERQVRSGGCVG